VTTLPELTFVWDTPDATTGRVTVTGNIVFGNAEEFLAVVTDHLVANRDLRELHIDCTGLGICDSRGLSALLMLRRRTETLGLALHILNRPKVLDRVAERTGTAKYLFDNPSPQRD
jgi:anti-anti-sigma factor